MDRVLSSNIDSMKRLNRIVIYPQDIALLTGRSDRYGRMIIKRIKEHLNKQDHQLITIQEYADYMAIDMQLIQSVLFG